MVSPNQINSKLLLPDNTDESSKGCERHNTSNLTRDVLSLGGKNFHKTMCI